VADKFDRFLHDRRVIFVGRFYWQTKLANFIVRLTSALLRTHECDDVDEDLVAENVDVQLAGDVADELHEHVLVRHLQQFVFRLADARRTLAEGAAHELQHVSASSTFCTEWARRKK